MTLTRDNVLNLIDRIEEMGYVAGDAQGYMFSPENPKEQFTGDGISLIEKPGTGCLTWFFAGNPNRGLAWYATLDTSRQVWQMNVNGRRNMERMANTAAALAREYHHHIETRCVGFRQYEQNQWPVIRNNPSPALEK